MVHVEDMSAAVKFYELLGAEKVSDSFEGDWVLLRFGNAELSLLAHPPNPEQQEGLVELNFQTDNQLAEIEMRLQDAGIDIAHTTSHAEFGRQLRLRTPDGLLVKINQLDSFHDDLAARASEEPDE